MNLCKWLYQCTVPLIYVTKHLIKTITTICNRTHRHFTVFFKHPRFVLVCCVYIILWYPVTAVVYCVLILTYYHGKVKISVPEYKGSICQVTFHIPQVRYTHTCTDTCFGESCNSYHMK